MEQDYYMDNTEVVQPEEPEEKTPKKKLDPQLAIIVMQVCICVAVLLACMIVKLFFGGYFAQMKDWYGKNVNTDTDIRQVLGTSSGGATGSGGPLETEQTVLTAAAMDGFLVPMQGEISSPFGYREDPFTGEYAMHHGLDIAAEQGTPILAAMAGTVVLASENNGDYGKYVIVDHGGFKTLYGHCSSLSVRVGDAVKAGQQVALCGSTGRSTGPHLHFEIRIGETRIDPRPFLNFSDNK